MDVPSSSSSRFSVGSASPGAVLVYAAWSPAHQHEGRLGGSPVHRGRIGRLLPVEKT